MPSRFIVALALVAVAPAPLSAQSSPPGDAIRCESCALTGQKPEPFDPAKTDAVPRVEPVFMPDFEGTGREPTTVRFLFIARVVGTSPLRLEVLDSRGQQVDRKMAVVMDDDRGGKDPGTCGLALGQTMAVVAGVNALLPSLRFNDLVSGAWMIQQNPKMPMSPLDGRPVVTELRKLSTPASWFHPVPATANCQNRSGRLIVFTDLSGGMLTVYNDGAIQFSSQYGQVFARENLAADEMKDLLAAFGAAGIDTVPAASDEMARLSGSRLTLTAARYQTVAIDSFHNSPPDTSARLTAVVARLHGLKGRAMANARLILRIGTARPVQPGEATSAEEIERAIRSGASRMMRAGARPDGTIGAVPVDITSVPELATLYGPKYLWPRDVGIRLADIPADGLIVPWSEVEQHKLVYYALLNGRFKGLTLIDGDRVFERVRLCQIDPASPAACPNLQ